MMRVFAAAILVVVFALSSWRGIAIPLKEQIPLYEGLRNTSGIIFGVMGAWLAILYPVAFQKFTKPGERGLTDDEERQVRRLLHPLIISTIILGSTVLLLFVAPVAKTFALDAEAVWVLRGLSFGLIGVMTVLQIWTVVLTLVPTDFLKRQIDGAAARDKKARSLTARTQVRRRDEE